MGGGGDKGIVKSKPVALRREREGHVWETGKKVVLLECNKQEEWLKMNVEREPGAVIPYKASWQILSLGVSWPDL